MPTPFYDVHSDPYLSKSKEQINEKFQEPENLFLVLVTYWHAPVGKLGEGETRLIKTAVLFTIIEAMVRKGMDFEQAHLAASKVPCDIVEFNDEASVWHLLRLPSKKIVDILLERKAMHQRLYSKQHK